MDEPQAAWCLAEAVGRTAAAGLHGAGWANCLAFEVPQLCAAPGIRLVGGGSADQACCGEDAPLG